MKRITLAALAVVLLLALAGCGGGGGGGGSQGYSGPVDLQFNNSPAGRVTAYLHLRDTAHPQSADVYISNLDGTNKQKIYSPGYNAWNLVWSLDGNYLAFSKADTVNGDGMAVLTVDITGSAVGGIHEVASGPTQTFDSWRTDGYLYYNVSLSTGRYQYKVRPDGSDRQFVGPL